MSMKKLLAKYKQKLAWALERKDELKESGVMGHPIWVEQIVLINSLKEIVKDLEGIQCEYCE